MTSPAPRIPRPYARLVGQEATAFRNYVSAAYLGGDSIRKVASNTRASFGRIHSTLVAAGVPRRPKTSGLRRGGN